MRRSSTRPKTSALLSWWKGRKEKKEKTKTTKSTLPNAISLYSSINHWLLRITNLHHLVAVVLAEPRARCSSYFMVKKKKTILVKPRLFKFIFLIFSGIDWQPKQVWSRLVHHHLLCDSSSYYCIFSRLYDRTLPVKMAKDVFFYKQFLNTPPNKLLLLPSTYSKVSVNLRGTRFIPAVHLGWFQASVTTIMKVDIEATFRLRCWSDSYTVFFFFGWCDSDMCVKGIHSPVTI